MDLKNILGFRRRLVSLFRPLIRAWMLKQSPQWARHRAGGLEKGEKVAVITGASSGIGKATARQLSTAGYKTILVSRDPGRLERVVDQIQIDGGEALIMKADLEQEEECSRLYSEISSSVGHVDVLVNSAGAGWYGYGDAMPWDEASKLIDINIKAYAQLTLTFLARMKERGQGHIINVSSVAGGLPSQGVAVYSATKSFVDTFTSSLHRELKDSGVYVSSVRPGAVITPFLDPILVEFKRLGIPFNRLAIRPERVGKGIARLVRRPRRVLYIPRVLFVVPWLELTFGWLIDRFGPLLLRGRDKAAF